MRVLRDRRGAQAGGYIEPKVRDVGVVGLSVWVTDYVQGIPLIVTSS